MLSIGTYARLFIPNNHERRRSNMVDVTECHALMDEMICTAIRFYGAEKNINNEAVFTAMMNLLCFSMIERLPHETDDEIKERFDKMLPVAIAEQREFAKTLPPPLKVIDGGKLN